MGSTEIIIKQSDGCIGEGAVMEWRLLKKEGFYKPSMYGLTMIINKKIEVM